MDYYAWGMVKEAAPYVVGIAGLLVLLWCLAPLALHWGYTKRHAGTKEGMHDADR